MDARVVREITYLLPAAGVFHLHGAGEHAVDDTTADFRSIRRGSDKLRSHLSRGLPRELACTGQFLPHVPCFRE